MIEDDWIDQDEVMRRFRVAGIAAERGKKTVRFRSAARSGTFNQTAHGFDGVGVAREIASHKEKIANPSGWPEFD